MAKIFYKDTIEGLEVTYDKLISDLSTETTYNPFCKNNSYYLVFKKILFSLLIGREVILLDSDYSDEEISKLLGRDACKMFDKEEVKPILETQFSDLIQRILSNKNSWKITLFTSGTTGLPKKVSHTFDSISRFVKQDEKRFNNIWGFAYNPTHMAGLQVFFQAFLNQNSIIRLFGVDKMTALELIDQYQITNISATPTFYRLLLPADHICESVRVMTSGGEKFDSNTLNSLQQMFPNSRIRNVYASTEAGSLFSAKGSLFTLKSEMSHLVKVVDHELYLHRSLMGESSSFQMIDDWYATGDLIDVQSEDPFTFKFISRKNEMINTGGYKVNPTDVEEAIRLCDGVRDVFVYGKKNSLLGNVICCEVVKSKDSLTEKQIRYFLKDKLQEFKIPRLVKFVESLTTTRTGKLSRV